MYQLQHQRLATPAQCQKVLLHFLSNGVQDFLLFPSFNSLLTSGFECKSHFKRLHLLPGQWQHISVWPSLCVSKNWLPRAAAALSGVVDVLPFFFFFVFSPNRNVGAGIIGHRRLFHLRRAVCEVNVQHTNTAACEVLLNFFFLRGLLLIRSPLNRIFQRETSQP